MQWLHRVAILSLNPDKLEFGNVGSCGGRETIEPGEKPSEQGQEPTTNSAHIQCQSGSQTWATLVRGECTSLAT